ncbi:PREDICTED: uncharacterized protein LOC101312938 [Fragaria vesca subsp. vesca]
MRAYSHDELETMSPEDILKAFKKNLTSKLDSLLVIAGNSDDDSIIVQTLDKIVVAATKFGKSFFEKIPMDMKVYVDCITLRKVEKPIGNHKCFVRLYKEGYRKKKLSAKTYKGTSLESMRRVASQIGHSLTSVFVKLMISLCVENQPWTIKRFDNLESLILLLKMMFKWKGKTNDFGVVFNRIIECIKIGRHEFLGVPKLTQKRRGTIELRRKTIDIIGCYSLNNFLQELVAELVGVPKLTQKRRGTIELRRKTIDIDDYYSLNNFLQELVTELVMFCGFNVALLSCRVAVTLDFYKFDA